MGRTALITGATGGLGSCFAHRLARDGCDLILAARGADRLGTLQRELEARYPVRVAVCPCDLSVPGAAGTLFAFTQGLGVTVDTLVNNAGFGDLGDFVSCHWARQQEMVQVNIVALMELTRLYLPAMVGAGRGRLLHVASAASLCAGPGMSVYFASKAFVRSFSEALSEELRGTGVTSTALCPGPTDTGFEKAAHLERARMFYLHAPAKAWQVADQGVDAMNAGKALVYCGAAVKLMALLTHAAPRALSRKGARFITGPRTGA